MNGKVGKRHEERKRGRLRRRKNLVERTGEKSKEAQSGRSAGSRKSPKWHRENKEQIDGAVTYGCRLNPMGFL